MSMFRPRANRKSNFRVRPLLTVCLILLAAHTATGQASRPDRLQTIAVVADQATIRTGVTDLLTAELSQMEDLQTVERAAIQSIVREQTLAAALTPTGSAERLKLGQLLKADLLVFMRLARSGKEQYLHCTISETSVGARLSQSIFAVGNRDPDRIAADCRQMVEETRQHFPNGIEQLVGVLPFNSQNLVHDFDALQSAYAALVQSALMRVAGVAVLEIDEARGIRRELELSDQELRNRLVPVIVDGAYKVNRDDKTVAVQVSLLDGNRRRKRIEKSGLTQDETIDLLTGPLVTQLLGLAESADVRPLTRKAQFDAFAKRASLLSGTSEHVMALPLREAALLITPDSFSQRVHSLYDIIMLWHVGPYRNWRQDPNSQKSDQETVDELQPLLSSTRTAFGHLEYLVAHRMINLREATILMIALNANTAQVRRARNPITGQYGFDEWRPVFRRLAERCLKLDPTYRDGTVHPSIWRLAGDYDSDRAEAWSHQAQFELFWNHVGRMLLARPDIRGPNGYDWVAWRQRELRRLIPMLAGQPMISASMVRRFAHLDQNSQNRPSPWFFRDSLASEEHTAGLKSVTTEFAHADGLSAIYGEWILLGLDLQSGVTPENFESLRRRVQALGDRTRPHIRPLSPDTYEARDIAVLPYEIEPLLRRHMTRPVASRPGVQTPSPYGSGKALNGKRHRPPRNPLAVIDPNPRVTFQRLDIPSMWTGMRQCTDQLDVYWNPMTATVMDRPGEFRTIYRQRSGNRNDLITDLHWDGERFWIVTQDSGIQLIAPDGSRHGLLLPDSRQVSDDEDIAVDAGASTRLPPVTVSPISLPAGHEVESFLSRTAMNFALQMHPVEPGRCIVWGRYGPSGRLWFADVRFTSEADDAFQIRVFHTATRVGARKLTPEEDADIRLIFRPDWHREMTLDGRRLLLIGRRAVFGQAARAPLAIDIESLEVRLVPLLLRESPDYISGETVLSLSSFGMQKHTRNSDGQSWKDKRIVVNSPGEGASRNGFLTWQDAVYCPGPRWTRLDPKTLTPESLTPIVMPLSLQFRHYGVSAHYGLVAWNPGDVLHRILIDAEPAEQQSDDAQFGFIPDEHRPRHAQAVATIRRHGGYVDSDWTRSRGSSKVRFDGPMWKTFVYLPATWRGGDDELAALPDLYNLIDLYMVEAPVTDKAMTHVGKLRGLQRLYLVDTDITDAGLKELWDLRRLFYIRLDGPVGGRHFTADGLKHLTVLPLNIISLYGPGFTEEALTVLSAFRKLRVVHAVDTGTSREAQQKLRIAGRPIRWTPAIPVSNMY